MLLSEFDYELPEELIAQHPLEKRDESRMLVVDRATRSWRNSEFSHFCEYVSSNDVVVVNNTKVFPARLLGQRDPTGGRVEVLLVRETEPGIWEVLIRPGHRLREGSRIKFGENNLSAEVLDGSAEGIRRIRLEADGSVNELIESLGQTPLPPYIKRPDGTSKTDAVRYQTVFARNKGAIAAPTAGLHFTPEVVEAIRERGAQVVEITLHVGYGTFEPVRVENIEQHYVAGETVEILPSAANTINQARENGGRLIAVGTTTVRALEGSANDGLVTPMHGETNLTIKPGYRFSVVDALLTNFHLPQSSLLLLVSAFAGRELVLDAYRHAVQERFRFYSYGDCMFVI